MFQTKVAEQIKTHILCSKLFFPDNQAVYVEKYSTGRQATIKCGVEEMHFACRKTKARIRTHTRSI